ncbi:MAG: response regulator transcription factor [Elusimicrobiota bacterium]
MGDRIVVIDDDEDFRLTIKDILEKAGYEVRLAGDGVTGLNLILESKPALVLADWVMPVMDGLQFVESLRASEQVGDVPVIMLTVKRSSKERDQALAAGAADYIMKPFETENLLERVRAAIDRKPA